MHPQSPVPGRRATVEGMARSAFTDDALLGLLFPFWQLVIGACVLGAVVVSVRRLARRGPSRMSRAMIVTAAAIIGLATIGLLLDSWFGGQ